MRQLLQKICCFWQAGSLQKYPPPPGVADINLNSPGQKAPPPPPALPRADASVEPEALEALVATLKGLGAGLASLTDLLTQEEKKPAPVNRPGQSFVNIFWVNFLSKICQF